MSHDRCTSKEDKCIGYDKDGNEIHEVTRSFQELESEKHQYTAPKPATDEKVTNFEKICKHASDMYVASNIPSTPEDENAQTLSEVAELALQNALVIFFRVVVEDPQISRRMKEYHYYIPGYRDRHIYLIPPELSGNEGIPNLAFIEHGDHKLEATVLYLESLKAKLRDSSVHRLH